jgi:hypothetical protein
MREGGKRPEEAPTQGAPVMNLVGRSRSCGCLPFQSTYVIWSYDLPVCLRGLVVQDRISSGARHRPGATKFELVINLERPRPEG